MAMKFIRIFLAILIVIGICLLLTQNLWVPNLVNAILRYEGSSTAVQPMPLITTTTGGPQVSESKNIVYKNTKYGFEFTLPARWKDYKVTENGNSLIFSLKQANPSTLNDGTKMEYQTVFIVTAFTHTAWEENQNAGDPSVNNFLAQNDTYVFGYLKGQDDAGFAGFPEVPSTEIDQGPFYDVNTIIIPSFKLD
jgi:hypothetical protein